MKKFRKIFFITVLSLFAVLIVTISVVLWLVFTPERFTPIVRKQAEKFITCQTEIGEVELTFFSTFPNFGFKVKQFALINPVADAPCDTLVNVKELVGVVDAAAWLKKKELILVGLELTGGSVYVFSDSLGNTNYDIVATDTTSPPETDSETMLPTIDIRNVVLNDVNFHYNDLSLKLNTVISDLTAKITGTITQDSISGIVQVSRSGISLEYDGEKYLQQASVQFDIPVDVIPSRQFIRLKNATASINDLKLLLNGTVENDTINQNIITDISYKFTSCPVKSMLALVPPSFHPYFEGIDGDGLLSSQGSIKGLLNNSVMPLMDIHLLLEKGIMKYAGFPLPLHDIEGDVTFYSDLKTDSLSFVRINRFNAKTPRSTFYIEGLVNHLFTDIHCNLSTNTILTLDELNPMIPDSMKVNLKGKAAGKVKAAFSLSQLKKMQLERMRLSGSVTLSDFDVTYDSISLKTDRSKIDFALPNRKASAKNTKFAFATILLDNMVAGKLESYDASLQNAFITLETSDVRDTTRIPDLICSFDMDSLFAEIDTMSIAIAKPSGKISLSPSFDRPDQPRIKLSYNSEQLKTIIGQNSAVVKKINIDTDILNDNTQKDIFLQWLVKGFIDMNQGTITMSGLSYPIEIPSIKMNFEPETFNIKEGIIQIDKSDFQLTGNLNNVLSYFRGDSILKGNFSFVSKTTDVSQLMALTSGLGNGDTTAVEQPEASDSDSTYTGPYMVPKGIDVLLSTNIKTATLGVDTATDIIGNVQLHDGILLLDGLTFDTPAARMQLTAMYRTPRKNHLFLGLDYHMLDVEIGELLTMIPDIDSLMPMLRSFGGTGEFHIAVETYLDSLYNIKKSTLRGASSIKGNNLVLMDGETFSEIAKKLKFNKKTVNKVDSLSAEFTIFRNEIDIYPFLIVMDKYKAVIAGRHNFDLSFDYHVSVVDCPLPIKLGVDIKGNNDNLSYSLARCRYAEYYRPASRRVVENKQLELRKMIRDTLTKKVKE
ncbi:MAG TPA: AsmA-like C-terminal region-containing protein [Bacteroidales bacterium]|nr:AsmA-like C-terminal region-containing protein [Bacteroidales bacterium]